MRPIDESNKQYERVLLLDYLFQLEGRDCKDHPQRGLYTGLYHKHVYNKAVNGEGHDW